ncbi:MAG: GNAT family N-acetyltransferase [Nitrospirae bacterium]|nr:GNAT family N-acetyltransferase [Nitrospirota bacterium]MCL5422461.1 GNAT family N-acetyltransferase [Nitrospirota bacterium]
MVNITIREANVEDLPSILSLHAQLDEGDVLPVKEARTIFGGIKRYPDYRIYVATIDKEIIGTFALLIMDNLAHMGAPSGIIEDVVVHQDWQRKGIGKQMMKFAMDYCRAKGCYKVALSSNQRRDEAHRFYESLGFQRHGYSFVVELNKDG